MAVTQVGLVRVNHNQTVNDSSVSFVIPAGAVAGDTAFVMLCQNTTSAAVYTAPTGWSRLAINDTGADTNFNIIIYGKDLVAGQGGATATFSSNFSGRLIGLMAVYRGSALVNFIETYFLTTTASTTVTAPSITTSADNTWVSTFWACRAAVLTQPTVTPPGSQTLDTTVATNFSAQPQYAITLSHRSVLGAAGTSGTITGTAAAASTAIVYKIGLPPNASISGTVSLTGSGTLTASGHPAMSGTVALSGSGLATSFGSSNGLAPLSGVGTLTATGKIGHSGRFTPSATGGLRIAGSGLNADHVGQLTLSSTGTLMFRSGFGIQSFGDSPFGGLLNPTTVKQWNGSTWVTLSVWQWSGSAWVAATIARY